MQILGKYFILIGIFFIGAGIFFLLGGKITWLGRLPGDIMIKKESFSFYFPFTSCLLVSVIITILLKIFFKK
ncbi:membrane protein [Candidatus Omnitrophus magneticus]|uniref:Membrane protein n=1 Tax=Candidatus Omnitrophus magneticus TaxID=1609969 RepID=A0A0F0CLE4_9BACT|nr:membrane protein [Candidatus Omnitrophus magneticus]